MMFSILINVTILTVYSAIVTYFFGSAYCGSLNMQEWGFRDREKIVRIYFQGWLVALVLTAILTIIDIKLF